MDVSINDLSFKGQFKNDDEAKACLESIASIINCSSILTGKKPVRRTRSLSSRDFIGNKTLGEFQSNLLQSKNPEDAKLLQIFLVSVVKGPFIQNGELNQDLSEVKSICGETVSGTALHALLSKTDSSISAVISAGNTGVYDGHFISLYIPSVPSKTLDVINLLQESCVRKYSRIYEANPKHNIKNDKVVAGEVHSRMDLSDAQAQGCLDNGFQVLGDKHIYYFIHEKWYEFPEHVAGVYHGYPIGNPNNKIKINRIKRAFGEPPYELSGYKLIPDEG